MNPTDQPAADNPQQTTRSRPTNGLLYCSILLLCFLAVLGGNRVAATVGSSRSANSYPKPLYADPYAFGDTSTLFLQTLRPDANADRPAG